MAGQLDPTRPQRALLEQRLPSQPGKEEVQDKSAGAVNDELSDTAYVNGLSRTPKDASARAIPQQPAVTAAAGLLRDEGAAALQGSISEGCEYVEPPPTSALSIAEHLDSLRISRDFSEAEKIGHRALAEGIADTSVRIALGRIELSRITTADGRLLRSDTGCTMRSSGWRCRSSGASAVVLLSSE